MYCLILLASLIFLPSFLSFLLWPCFLHLWWQIISTDWHLTKSCFLIGLKASHFITGLNYIEKSCWWCSQKMRNAAVMWRSRVLQRESLLNFIFWGELLSSPQMMRWCLTFRWVILILHILQNGLNREKTPRNNVKGICFLTALIQQWLLVRVIRYLSVNPLFLALFQFFMTEAC